MLGNDILKHAGEFGRALRNGHYERSNSGLLFPQQHVHINGAFTTWVNDEDEQVDANLVTTQGLTYLLGVALGGVAQLTAWYLAPFSGNVTPTAGYTAAGFTAAATEFIAYDEATRRLLVPGTITASLSNSASRATFTMSTGVVAQTLYGCGLLSASAKSAITGTCFAATRFASARTGLNAGDVVSAQYDLASTST